MTNDFTPPRHEGEPFDALRIRDTPLAPRAAFTTSLRDQLTDRLRPLLAGAPSPSAIGGSTMTITPYLSVRNAAAALDFYRDAFGAVETQRLVGDDGRIGHAEFTVGGALVMLADEYPELDIVGPETRGGPTCQFELTVPDVDAAFARAVSFGAVVRAEPADQFHGNRRAIIADPFGHRWMISAPSEQLTTEEYSSRAAEQGFALTASDEPTESHDHQIKHHERGDLYYFSLPVADVARAQTFYAGVLGWDIVASPDGGHIANISAPPGGVNARGTDVGARLWFAVDDIHTAVARVRELGGSADEPVHYDSGWSADCTDDQGTVFSLSVPADQYTR